MRFLFLLVLLVASGCSSSPRGEAEAPVGGFETVVYLVRHAEAEDDGTRNPPLSARGRERAARLAERLTDADAVYATPYLRTQETAAPLAEASGVEAIVVPIGDEGVPGYIADVTARVRALPAGSIAVVVGHSNTTPHVAGAFAGVEMEDLSLETYDRLFVITLTAAGTTELVETTY